MIGLSWRPWRKATAPTWNAEPEVQPQASADPPASVIAAPVRVDETPARLTMSGILKAWRAADRALAELVEGSPEWAAVNARLISLRAVYLARFDEYLAGAERPTP